MNKLSQRLILVVLGSVGWLTGCANDNRMVGHHMTERREWHGEMGITGHLNNVTIVPPSRITKLSVMGDGNEVTIMDTVTCGKIEVWGNNNKFHIPTRLVVRISNVGDNQFIREDRPGEAGPVTVPSSIFPGGRAIEPPPPAESAAPSAGYENPAELAPPSAESNPGAGE